MNLQEREPVHGGKPASPLLRDDSVPSRLQQYHVLLSVSVPGCLCDLTGQKRSLKVKVKDAFHEFVKG